MLILILLPLLVSSPLHEGKGHHSQSHSHTSQSSSTELDGKKKLSKPYTTGSGKYLYEVDSQWVKLPKGVSIGTTHGGVAVSDSGRIYISTNANKGIVVFDADGNYIGDFGKEFKGTHSLIINEEKGVEYLYAAQLFGKRIIKVDLEGNIVQEINHSEKNPIPGTLKGITAVAVGEDGRIYATTGYDSNHLHIFSPAGVLLKSLGSKGKGKGQTNTNHGVAIDKRYNPHRLIVADRENRRLVHHSLEGDFLSIYAENLRRPCSFSFFGNICAVAELQGRVTLLDQSGNVLTHLGDNPNRKQWAGFKVPIAEITPGAFSAPHGLAFNKKGDLIVQDWNVRGRISKLTFLKN